MFNPPCSVTHEQVSKGSYSLYPENVDQVHVITLGGFGLFIQGAGLAPEAFPGAIDPDVGDHACVALGQTHVLLTHSFVKLGAA